MATVRSASAGVLNEALGRHKFLKYLSMKMAGFWKRGCPHELSSATNKDSFVIKNKQTNPNYVCSLAV